MKFLKISNSTKLIDLVNSLGSSDVDDILHLNNVERVPNIGQAFNKMCKQIISSTPNVSWQRKSTILNSMSGDSDVFEYAAMSDESTWKVLSKIGTFPNMLQIPLKVAVPDSVDILGNDSSVVKSTYEKTLKDLSTPPHTIDINNFSSYAGKSVSGISDRFTSSASSNNVYQYFKIPWGDVTLYSSLSNESMDFPVYPETISDGWKANYTTMPDTIYQYEPWQLYESSGPRSNSYVFKFHRDMWTGDHKDGMANKLIRFCAANCYPKYTGSVVNTSTVTLYVKGDILISGVMTDVSVNWDGPIGHDGWYLGCELTLNITEVSPTPLSYDVMKAKPIIG